MQSVMHVELSVVAITARRTQQGLERDADSTTMLIVRLKTLEEINGD